MILNIYSTETFIYGLGVNRGSSKINFLIESISSVLTTSSFFKSTALILEQRSLKS